MSGRNLSHSPWRCRGWHRDHAAIQRVERREQRCRSVALVVVGDGAGAPALHRQPRLRAIQRLDLTLFVTAERQSVFGRVQVQPDDIGLLTRDGRSPQMQLRKPMNFSRFRGSGSKCCRSVIGCMAR